VFNAYEGYEVMECEGHPEMYMRDVINSIPGLVRAFSSIALQNDSVGVFKSILAKKEL
jgi:hypothetical protein